MTQLSVGFLRRWRNHLTRKKGRVFLSELILFSVGGFRWSASRWLFQDYNGQIRCTDWRDTKSNRNQSQIVPLRSDSFKLPLSDKPHKKGWLDLDKLCFVMLISSVDSSIKHKSMNFWLGFKRKKPGEKKVSQVHIRQNITEKKTKIQHGKH